MSLQQHYTPKRPITPTAVLLALFFVPHIVFADWVVHEHLPRWAQRGAMRACVAPFDAHKLRPWIDSDPLACKFNLLFTGHTAWEDARTPAEEILKHYIRPLGGHLFFYTCPNSIYWDDEFERVGWRDDLAFERYRNDNFHRQPYAKECINYDRDGRPTIAYPWPSRRHRTSYFAERWVAHHSQVLDYMVKGRGGVTNKYLLPYMKPLRFPGIVDGFYFDNAGLREDWGPLAMERWKQISKKRFGEIIDPRTSQNPAVRMAWKDMQYRAFINYHNAFRRHGWTFERPRLTMLGFHVPQAYYAAEVNYPDIMFYENTYRAQPQGDNIWSIKRGLAATDGKAQACLNHERFRRERLDPKGEFKVLNWQLSREFARLSMAECMAMSANHMVQMGPLMYAHMRYGQEYILYNTFNEQLEDELYHNATPGAKLAVLWPISSEARGTADNEPLGRRLWTLGYPYEVIVERDLTSEIWRKMDMDILILPDARCLNEERINVVLDWVRKGGRCLVSQALGERDEFGLRQSSKAARELLGDLGARIRYAASIEFQMRGFETEQSGRIWLPARRQFTEKTLEGTASVVFKGEPGKYDLRFDFLDEADGECSLTVFRNQDPIRGLKLDRQTDRRSMRIIPGVSLKTGDNIRIHAKQDNEEFCRIYGLELIPSGADLEKVTWREVGKGKVAFLPQNLMEHNETKMVKILEEIGRERLERCGYQREPNEMGAIFCNMLRDKNGRGLQVHLVNASYSTTERYTPLVSSEAICRADVFLKKLPSRPVVRAQCWGIGDEWKLLVTVNGKELKAVEGSKVRGVAWINIPAPEEYLKAGETNRVTLRVEGKLNRYSSAGALYIDTTETDPKSAFAGDGTNFSSDDLSTLKGKQTGAYKIRICEAYPVAPRPPKLGVRLSKRRSVIVKLNASRINGNTRALVVSPDHPPFRLPVSRRGKQAELVVPKLDVYSVLLLSSDEAYLDAVESKARRIRYQRLPKRSSGFQKLLAVKAAGSKLTYGSLEGDTHLGDVETIDPQKVTVRNDTRYFGKELERDRDYRIEKDGKVFRLPGCRTYSEDKLFITWTDIEGGHYREPYAAYMSLDGGQLVPPGWRPANKVKLFRETEPVNVRHGKASARVEAMPRGGLSKRLMTVDAGRPHRLSVWIKVAEGEAQVRIIRGAEGEPTVVSSASQWKQVAIDFKPIAAQVDFRIEGALNQKRSVFYVDDASMVELPVFSD